MTRSGLIVLSLTFYGCGPDVGACNIVMTQGSCTVIELAGSPAPSPSPTSLPASDPTATVLSFTPVGASQPTAIGALRVQTGANDSDPSLACLASNHITLGAVLSCTQVKDTAGPCGPPTYTVSGFSPSAAGCP